MAKVINRPGIRVTQRVTGIMHTATLAGGRVVYKKWPVKRGKTKPGPVADMRQAFAWAARNSVYAIDQDKIVAVEWSKGSMYYPRDILVAAMYGTLITVHLAEGGYYYPARQVAQNVQLLLDQISKTPGALLLRGADQWISINPGTFGQVLTAQGPGLMPLWLPSSGGGGGGVQGSVTRSIITAAAYLANGGGNAAIGVSFTPNEDFEIAEVWARITPTAGMQYAPWVAELTGTATGQTIISVTVGTPVTWGTSTAVTEVRGDMGGNVSVLKDHIYGAGLVRLDSTDTATFGVNFANTSPVPLMFPAALNFSCSVPHKTLAAGQAINSSSNSVKWNCIGLGWKLPS